MVVVERGEREDREDRGGVVVVKVEIVEREG